MKGKKILNILKNKYLITIIGFGVWLLLFDQHNLVDRFKTRKYLSKLIEDTAYYQKQIVENETIIEKLKTDADNLEEFAREEYMMKAEDEDIFVIIKK